MTRLWERSRDRSLQLTVAHITGLGIIGLLSPMGYADSERLLHVATVFSLAVMVNAASSVTDVSG